MDWRLGVFAIFKGSQGRFFSILVQGRGARYVTGKAPLRIISSQSKPIASLRSTYLENAEDTKAAILAGSAIAWDARREALSNAKLRKM